MKKINGLAIAGFIAAASMLMGVGEANAQSKDTVNRSSDKVHGGWHHGRNGGRGHMGRAGAQNRQQAIPNLTSDQQKQIDALKTPFQKDMLALRNQMAEKQAHLRTLQTAEKTDLSAINGTIDDIGKLQTQLMKKTAAHHDAVRKLLTDDQRVAFDSHRGHRGAGKGMRRF